jgi:nitrogen fixation/metabolism regulation signal transduction histidine kinase
MLHAAVTVSSLGPRRANPGYVVVIDDLTDLLRAQKAAAWQVVAQRIAHEIKNPLTPIQLSAQRLTRYLERVDTEQVGQASSPVQPVPSGVASGQTGRSVLPEEFSALARECTALIEREVATLKALVDEFSQFARFPAARPEPVEINRIVTGALDVFSGRLDGVRVHSGLAPGLPQVKADPELLRRVLVNLIDNAAEAMEGSTYKELAIVTRLVDEGDSVEVVVADSGHGIPPEDKDRLFLPRFSTRSRGSGLGLAIAARIVAEHGGAIRAEDNSPIGARFIVRLPAIEVPAPQRAADD